MIIQIKDKFYLQKFHPTEHRWKTLSEFEKSHDAFNEIMHTPLDIQSSYRIIDEDGNVGVKIISMATKI